MYNELNQHKKSDTVKWIVSFALIIILIAGLIGAWAMILKLPATEENEQEKQTDVIDGIIDDVIDSEGNAMTNNGVYAMPTAMLFRTVSAKSATYEGVTVSATVKPDSAVNKLVDWVVSWQNPEAEWAVDKTATDYVTATPSSDGSTTATITCLAPFAEQIKVSVISRSNPGAYAIMTVDFAEKITGISAIATNEAYKFDGTTLQLTDSSTWSNNQKDYSDYWDLTYTYSEGSVDPVSVTNVDYYIKASDELSAAYSSVATEYVEMLDNMNDMLEKALGISLFIERIDKTQDPVYQLGPGGEKIPVWPKITTFNSAVWNNAVEALNGLTGHAFDLKIVTTDSNGDQQETVLQISVDKGTIGAQVNSIELTNEALVF